MGISAKKAEKRSRVQRTLVPPEVGKKEALGQSEIFLEFQERLSCVARVNRPVLLIGERGTGKELAVARLHYLSPRWQGPLVALNCAALSPTLIETELLAMKKGPSRAPRAIASDDFRTTPRGYALSWVLSQVFT